MRALLIPDNAMELVEDFLDERKIDYREIPNADENMLGPSNDKDTSKKAAEFNYPRSGTQRHRVLMALAEAGEHGLTRDEICEWLQKRRRKKISESAIDARVWELEKKMGYIEPTGRARMTQTGALAEVLTISRLGALMISQNER